jgi:DNA polymerase
MIAAMGLDRRDVYIANVVKCRPPGNRNPEPAEIVRCMPYLRRQLEIVAPRVICTLGNVATRAILETGDSIGRLRGRFGSWRGIGVLPTFHPSYLLRNPEDKKLAWSDLRKIMAVLELPGAAGRPKQPGTGA